MSTPRLEDLGRRIRDAEKRFASQIQAYTVKKIQEQLAAGNKYAIGHFTVYRESGKWVAGPMYPGQARSPKPSPRPSSEASI